MGVRFPGGGISRVPFAGPGVAVQQNIETIIATTPLMNLPLDAALVCILWWVQWTVNTGATSVAVNIRRGATTGAASLLQAGQSQPVTAATGLYMSGVMVDNPGAVSAVQYSLTLLTAAATAGGTANDYAIYAFAL